MSSEATILVCCHKHDSAIRDTDLYRPIQVGAVRASQDLGFAHDNDTVRGGGNISQLNHKYCELTALYWAWREMQPVRYVGLAHYRRYFADKVTPGYVEKTLGSGRYDVITCLDVVEPHLNWIELVTYIGYENYYIMADTVVKQHPEYYEALQRYSFESNCWVPFNMFVSSWQWMQDYCEWLFPILQEVEQRIRPAVYTRDARSLGYMGEFLLGVYLMHTKARRKQVRPSMTMRKFRYKHRRRFWYHLRHFLRYGILNSVRIGHIFGKKGMIVVYPAVKVGLQSDGIELAALNAYNDKHFPPKKKHLKQNG